MKFSQRFRETSTYMGYMLLEMNYISKSKVHGDMPMQRLKFHYAEGFNAKNAFAMGDVTYGMYVDPNSTVQKPWYNEDNLSLHKIGLASGQGLFPGRMRSYRNRQSGVFVDGGPRFRTASQPIINKHIERYSKDTLIHIFGEAQKTHMVKHWSASLGRFSMIPALTVDWMEQELQAEGRSEGENLCYQVQGK